MSVAHHTSGSVLMLKLISESKKKTKQNKPNNKTIKKKKEIMFAIDGTCLEVWVQSS